MARIPKQEQEQEIILTIRQAGPMITTVFRYHAGCTGQFFVEVRTPAMRCILGIDSGGSKCDALVVRDDGVAIGWGQTRVGDTPARGRNFGGFGRNPRSVGLAIRQAITGLKCDELHLVGLTTYFPLALLRDTQIGSIACTMPTSRRPHTRRRGSTAGWWCWRAPAPW